MFVRMMTVDPDQISGKNGVTAPTNTHITSSIEAIDDFVTREVISLYVVVGPAHHVSRTRYRVEDLLM